MELGEGAHAVVYLGELNGDPVAVKVGWHPGWLGWAGLGWAVGYAPRPIH